MFKARKKANRQKPRRRTSLEIEEEQSRTLYIRLPHTIKKVDEIKDLFFGDFKVKLPRQSSRHCHIIFNDVEQKIKNLKAVKKKAIDGKPIYAGPPKPINLEKPKKPKQKKVVMPEPKPPSNEGKYIFVSNIPAGIKAPEVKAAFPGAVTIALLKGLVNGKRNAKLKMSSSQLCSHYANDKANWPVFKEQKVCVCLAKKSTSSNKKKQKKTKPLKIYDGESEQKEQSKEKESDSKDADSSDSDEKEEESDSKNADSADSDEEDGSEEEEEEDAEEESSSEEEE